MMKIIAIQDTMMYKIIFKKGRGIFQEYLYAKEDKLNE